MANRNQIQTALHKPYDKLLFAKEVLSPVFGSCFSLSSSSVLASVQPNRTEQSVVDSVSIYGKITLEDNTEITCYEIVLQPTVRIEQSKVAIQRYVRKLLTAGQAALVNFVAHQNKKVWRLTLVAKDSELTDEGIKEKTTHAKRYTYLLGPNETCKTAAERFEILSTSKEINLASLIEAFSVEKLGAAFFDEYTLHYEKFCEFLQKSKFRKSVFNVSFPTDATDTEQRNAYKPIRDFVKKMLGRIVFLYFVQKKGWLGASDNTYKDGMSDFVKELFRLSGGDGTFYMKWLTQLFFETLNKERSNDDFILPDGRRVKVPFLNGGLFDKEEYDEHVLVFEPKLFHNLDYEEVILTKKSKDYGRGFLDFLNAFNFTIHEDSPEDHTVAVDPEMLGHIFENLLEDSKDKGSFYTPKEVVHYMCQESLTEYLWTHLSKDGGKSEGVEGAINLLVNEKEIGAFTGIQLERIDQLLDLVKICDPAIGSGAFPMGLLQEIFSIKEVINYELKKKWIPASVKESIIQNSIYGVDNEKGAVDIARLRFWLSLVVDEDIPRALPNLDFKIVVGDSLVSKVKFDGHEEIVEIDWSRVKQTSNTKDFINSNQAILKAIAEKQKKYFKQVTKNKKQLHADIRNLKLELLINQLSFNKQLILAKNVGRGGFAPTASDIKYNEDTKLLTKNLDDLVAKLEGLKNHVDRPFEHFDWKLDFPEVLNPNLVVDEKQRGFDILIANPPYVGEKGNKDKFHQIKLGFLKEYYNAKMDLFYFFFHQAINVAKYNGSINFITTNYYPTADGAFKLRSHIKSETQIVALINFNEFRIFDSALGQHNMITFLKKSKEEIETKAINVNRKNESGLLILRSILDGRDEKTNYLKFKRSQVFEGERCYIRTNQIGSTNLDSIFESIIENSIPLVEVASINSGCDITISRITDKHIEAFPDENYTKGSGVFVLNESEVNQLSKNFTAYEKELVKAYVKNSDIEKYTHSNSDDYLLYIDWDVAQNKIPNIIKHLRKYKPILDDQIARYNEPNWPWYSLHRPREKAIFSNPEKIIVPYRAIRNVFALSTEEVYSSRDVFYISILNQQVKISIEALLGVLNSKLIYFWLYNKGKRKGEILELYYTPLSEIPIRNSLFNTQLRWFVKSILFLLTQNLKAVTDQLMPTYFEQIIDGIVYELYLPELILKNGREVVKHLGNLPELDDLSAPKKLAIIKTVFNRLNEREHPVRVNLFYMNSIDQIAIIEGKDENR